MYLATYLGVLHHGEQTLESSYSQVAHGHVEEPDIRQTCLLLAAECARHVTRLQPLTDRYGERPSEEPARLHAAGLTETRAGPVGLLRDLHDLYLLASYV